MIIREEEDGMTKQLYYQDVYMKEFDASVISCREGREGFEIFLDRSAFFPEGGGQSGDRGYLIVAGGQSQSDHGLDNGGASGQQEACFAAQAGEKVTVLDTQQENDEIYVVCDRPVAEGSSVHGVLDWQFRFDRMQNHSGEHIVSGIIHRRYGYQNVGFHMSQDRMTIDLSGEITDEALREIEAEANRIVWTDVPVRTDVYTEEEAAKVEFRSKKDLHGIIRVVTIPGADVCACCGTHVKRTGEIGPIRLISHEKFRGGIRIELSCGRWAYEYMSGIFDQNHQVSALVSARPLETAKAVRKVLDDENALKFTLLQMSYAEIDREADKLEGAGPVLIFAKDYDPVLVQKLAAKVMEKNGGIAIVMSGADQTDYHYAAGEKDGDLKTLIKEMNQNLSGKGGGRPYFQQGSLKADKEQITEYLKNRIEGLTVTGI